MENRFSHQDQIIDNLSNVVKTFSDTLKVIGKEAWKTDIATYKVYVFSFFYILFYI
jgi:hypothetical protein